MHDNFTFLQHMKEEQEKEKQKELGIEDKPIEPVKPVLEEPSVPRKKSKKKKKEEDKKTTLLKLVGWIAFVIVLVIFMSLNKGTSNLANSLNNINGNKDNSNKDNTIKEDTTILTPLTKNNYHFTLEINKNSAITNYKGTRKGVDTIFKNINIDKWYYIKNSDYYIYNVTLSKFDILEDTKLYPIDEKYLNITNIITYLELGKIDYETTYTSKDKGYGYKVLLKDLIIDSESDDFITIDIKKYEATSNIDLIIDYSNYLKTFDNTISNILVTYKFDNISKITDIDSDFALEYGPKDETEDKTNE